MTTLYFVHPDAARLHMSVAAVNGGQRLVPGKAYRVSDALAAQLLDTGDWSREKPGAPEVATDPIVETDGDN